MNNISDVYWKSDRTGHIIYVNNTKSRETDIPNTFNKTKYVWEDAEWITGVMKIMKNIIAQLVKLLTN